MVKLGDEVKDPITGFKGIAVCRHSYLNGCDRISVQPKIDKKGEVPADISFDEPQLEILKNGVIPQGETNTGGPVKYESNHKKRRK